MSKQTTKKLVPKLRFPEFRDAGEWNKKPLDNVFARITTKNKKNNQNVLTISAQMGLVSQLEYFNKTVASKDVTGYYILQKGDFAYNKSYSKGYPMGAIKSLKNYDNGVVSTLYICFRAKNSYKASFFEQYFDSGVINSEIEKIAQEGGRNHGLLNVSVKEFFEDICVYVPQINEQQKIADSLSSIDDLIIAHTQKHDALKAHKKGLVQQLFPAEGETVPKLRFFEFRGAKEWVNTTLGGISTVTSGGTPARSKKEFWNGNIPWVTTSLIDFNIIQSVNEFISKAGLKESSAKIFPKNTILMAMYGQGITRGKVAVLGIDAATNQACAAILMKKELNTNFVFQNLASRYDEIRDLSNRGGQANLSGGLIEEISFSFPESENEQQKIADCLSSLDDLITAQAQKIESLKAHKKGLMQQLLPAVDEVEA